MRTVFRIILLLAILWTGYWGAVWLALSQGLPRWLAVREAEGWQAEAGALSVAGYPTRFRTTVEDVALADPETGLAWRAPRILAETSAIRPLSLRVWLPAEHRLAAPEEKIDIRSDAMEASLSLAPDPDLPVTSATIELRAVQLSSSRGWTAGLSEGRLNADRVADDPLSYEIEFSARDARPAEPLLRQLDPAGLLPATFDSLGISARARFDAPWDRRAIEVRRPQPTQIDLGRLAARWGEMELEAAGNLTVDADGRPEGRISLRVINWRDMLAVASGNGWVPEGLLPTIENALGLLAGLSGRPDTIDAPLSFQNGFMSLGPVPLGPAPRFLIR